jgi:hypothetical protein
MPNGGGIVKEKDDKCILVKHLGMFYVSERVGWGTRTNVTVRVNLVYE